MSKPKQYIQLQCRLSGQPWHNLTSQFFDGETDKPKAMRAIIEQRDRWSMQPCMEGHEFRILGA